MRVQRSLGVALATSLLLVLASCDSPMYTVGLRNWTDEAITDVKADLGEVGTEKAFLAKNGLATVSHARRNPASKATVQWRTADGAAHTVEVPVPKLPRSFGGTLLIKIHKGDKVTIVLLSQEEYFRGIDDP